LGLFSRTGHQQATATAPQRQGETYKSLALKALFQALREDRKYHSLDLGPAFGLNINFLSQFSSKIRVEDLYSTLHEQRFFDRAEGEPVDESQFSKILAIPSHERFDIILCWDLMNYLKTEELRALVCYLSRFCASGAYFFLICSTLKEIPAAPIHFRIADSETLLYAASSPEVRPGPRYAPRDLGRLMTGFKVQNSFNLKNGMQEYLFVRE
jgi:hypothetical protein